MPFQQISLDQSIYKKKQSPMSSALRSSQYKGPIVNPSQGWTGLPGFSDEAKGIYQQNSFVEKQKAEWAAEDKAKKVERDAQMQKLQEVGMQTVKQAQQQQQQAQQQQAEIKQKVEENPEPFAEEQWKFFLSLDEEGQKRFTDQIFAPSPQQSTINGQPVPNAKTKYAGGAIADYWINKGYVMFDPKGNVVVNKPVKEAAKDTFKTVEHDGNLYSFNSSNGKEELLVKGSDIPKGITTEQLMEVFKEAADWALGGVDPAYLETLSPEAKENYYAKLDAVYEGHVTRLLKNTYNLTLEEATKIANGLPPLDKSNIEGTGGGTTDPTIVRDLKKLFDENPNEIANRKAYEDKYGAENVAAALGGTVVAPITPPKQTPKAQTPTEPTVYSKGVLGKAGAALNKIFQPK